MSNGGPKDDFNYIDASEVTNTAGLFSGKTTLLGDVSKWNVSDMSFMFYASNRFNVNISGWSTDSVSKCKNFSTGSPLIDSNEPKKGGCRF